MHLNVYRNGLKTVNCVASALYPSVWLWLKKLTFKIKQTEKYYNKNVNNSKYQIRLQLQHAHMLITNVIC